MLKSLLKGEILLKLLNIGQVALLFPFLYRYLTTVGTGQLSLINTTVIIGSTFVFLGIPFSFPSFLVSLKTELAKKYFYSQGLIFTLITSILFLIIYFLSSFIFLPHINTFSDTLMLSIPFAVITRVVFAYINGTFHSLLKYKQYYNMQYGDSILQIIIRTTVLLLGLNTSDSILYIIVGLALSNMLCAVYGINNLKPYFVKVKKSLRLFKLMIFIGFTKLFDVFGDWLITGADKYILFILFGSGVVGIYSVSHQLIIFISTALFTGIVGWLSVARSKAFVENNKQQLKKFNSINLIFDCYIIFPIIMGFAMYGKSLFRLYAGDEFISGFDYIFWLGIGYVFLIMSSYLSHFLILRNIKLYYFSPLIFIACGILNIIFNLIFVPIYGPIASAISTAFSMFCMLFVSYMLLAYYKRLPDNHISYLIHTVFVLSVFYFGSFVYMPTDIVMVFVYCTALLFICCLFPLFNSYYRMAIYDIIVKIRN